MRREGSKKPSGLFDNMKPVFTGRVCPAVIAIIVVVACGSSAAFAQAIAQEGARIAGASVAATAVVQGQGLAAVGPIDPANGFPQFYQDKAGLSLAPCLDTTTPGDPCVLAGTIPNPTQPITFPGNFPEEFFYAAADATIQPFAGVATARAILTLRMEGAFGNAAGTVANGDQVVFARFRFRARDGVLTPGATYTVTYPFGTQTFVAEADGTINTTDDQGCVGVPPSCDFGLVLTTTNVGPFLKWDSTAPAPPAGFIGDGVTPHKITGSPTGNNIFRVDGPNVGGLGVNTIQTDLFTVIGKIFVPATPAALTVDRTSFSRTAAGGSEIDLFVHTAGNATVVATGTGIPNTTLTTDPATGRAYARIVLAPGAAVPQTIHYTATVPGSRDTVRDGQMTDEVTVARATYSMGTRSLTVNATSSDQVGAPTLSAAGTPNEPLGTLSGGTLTVPLAMTPYQVNVTSSAGGKDSLLVDLTQ